MLQATSMIRLNKSEFQQVILNLVNNAIDALSNLQNTDKKITIRTREKNNYLEFSVIDNGIGVPKELEASIFMLMKTNKQTGMGLGLWLSKHIVDRHNGQISYQKTQSGCIEFLIRLPLNLEY
jgi:signal transduction histidine kinase